MAVQQNKKKKNSVKEKDLRSEAKKDSRQLDFELRKIEKRITPASE
jgi:hypothetical protein